MFVYMPDHYLDRQACLISTSRNAAECNGCLSDASDRFCQWRQSSLSHGQISRPGQGYCAWLNTDYMLWVTHAGKKLDVYTAQAKIYSVSVLESV